MANNMPNEMSDGAITIIATVISTVVASIIAWVVAHRTNRSASRQALADEVTKIIDLGMEYPFVEDDAICDRWPEWTRTPDDKMRYENYCCYVFNVMQHVWEYCGSNLHEIQKILHVEELIWRHRCWWENEPENSLGYQKGFQSFVDRLLQRKRKELGQ